MKDTLATGLKSLGVVLALTGLRTQAAAQSQTQPSGTVLVSNSPTLTLPGNLNLTATVTGSGTVGGVPTGNIAFSSNGTSLGSAALQAVPSSWSFPAAGVDSTFAATYGDLTAYANLLTAVDLFGTGTPALLVAGTNYSSANLVYLYANTGNGSFADSGTAPVSLPNDFGATPDAIAPGYFLNPTTKSVVVHSFPYYDVIGPGSGGALVLAQSSPAGNSGSTPDTERLVVDDFNGDGYSDLGVLVLGNDGVPAAVGFAINYGDGSGSFNSFDEVTLPAPVGNNSFCPDAIASGKFTASLNAELAVLGHYGDCSSGAGVTSSTPSYVALYSYEANFLAKGPVARTSKRRLAPMASIGGLPQQVGVGQTTLAAADFNGDGHVDLIIGGFSSSSSGSGQVQIYTGDGAGNFSSSPASTTLLAEPPASFTLADYNGDGAIDAEVAPGSGAGIVMLLGNGSAGFAAPLSFLQAGSPISTSVADLNGDGLYDLAFLQSSNSGASTITVLLGTETAQAALTTPNQSLPAGTDSLTATYAGNTNFAGSSSAALVETVTRSITTLTWPAITPASIPYGTPVSAAQLDATANVAGSTVYTTGNTTLVAGTTILPIGRYALNAAFTPADTFDYTSASAQNALQVTGSLASAQIESPSDPGQPQTTANPTDQVGVAITVAPHGDDETATITLSFADTSANPAASNGSVFFVDVPSTDTLTPNSTQGVVDTFVVPAGTSGTLPLRSFAVGDVQGVVTATVQLTGQNIGQEQQAPAITVVPAVPLIQSVNLSTVGSGLQVVVTASSSTREISGATFHFTAAAGHSIKTPDVPASPATQFQQWFSNADSAADGSGFTYTQPFTLNVDPNDIESVTVTLTNTVGNSQPVANQ